LLRPGLRRLRIRCHRLPRRTRRWKTWHGCVCRLRRLLAVDTFSLTALYLRRVPGLVYALKQLRSPQYPNLICRLSLPH
jgi:hypothetical protein